MLFSSFILTAIFGQALNTKNWWDNSSKSWEVCFHFWSKCAMFHEIFYKTSSTELARKKAGNSNQDFLHTVTLLCRDLKWNCTCGGRGTNQKVELYMWENIPPDVNDPYGSRWQIEKENGRLFPTLSFTNSTLVYDNFVNDQQAQM